MPESQLADQKIFQTGEFLLLFSTRPQLLSVNSLEIMIATSISWYSPVLPSDSLITVMFFFLGQIGASIAVTYERKRLY